MFFKEFLESIPKINNIPLTGESSHLKMAPPIRKALFKKQDAIKSAKFAGVLALFYPDGAGQTKFVLILRKTYNGVHSAQIGFPGGKLEKEDKSLKHAAVRETFEEVGVPIKDVQVVRELSPVYIPPSNFYVHPFIAITEQTPEFVIGEYEVEAIVEVLLVDFMNNEVEIENKVKTSYSIEIDVPAFKLNGYVVWGATAMMLSEIKDLFKQVF